GPAEPLERLGTGWQPVGAAGLFLYRRGATSSSVSPDEGEGRQVGATVLSPPPLRGRDRVGGGPGQPPGALPPHPIPPPRGGGGGPGEAPRGPPPAPPPAPARRLADAGSLDDARTACEALLARAPDADTYSLLGLIHTARHDPAVAAECFRKALY